MGRINIPAAPQMSASEKPYWWVQAIPDRIKYTIMADPPKILASLILGSNGFHAKVEKYLKVLHQSGPLAFGFGLDILSANLYGAWQDYDMKTRYMSSDRLRTLLNDQQAMTLLLNFQRMACVVSSYKSSSEKGSQGCVLGHCGGSRPSAHDAGRTRRALHVGSRKGGTTAGRSPSVITQVVFSIYRDAMDDCALRHAAIGLPTMHPLSIWRRARTRAEPRPV